MLGKKKIFVVFLVLFSILLTSFAFYAYQIIYTPNILVGKDAEYFLIDKDDTFKDVQNNLYEGNYVQDLVSFSFLARLMDYDVNVKPGLYYLESRMTNIQAIRRLRSGEQIPVAITFNNIRLSEEIGPRITRNTMVTPEDFQVALDSFVRENDLGFNKENIIGMFIPNTYQVFYTATAEDLVERMLMEYQRFWNEDRLQKAQNLGLTPLEVSTLASIVQAESRQHPDEWPVIAGLYLNRLRKGMALQADPTLVFAAGDFSIKRVLNVHKTIDSPYNTYRRSGLPPGPINMPDIRALDAVLNSDQHEYLYMCAREDFSGYHNFAKTFAEHKVNAQKYQRALTIEQRKARQKQN